MKTVEILLVEDNEGDITLLKEAFEESNFSNNITVIKDGKEAIDYFDNVAEINISLPDLVLLDINLPKKNGHQVIKHIKTSEKTKHIPVIMFTTSSSEKDKKQCFENGVDHFMSKPLDVQGYEEAVASIEEFFYSKQN